MKDFLVSITLGALAGIAATLMMVFVSASSSLYIHAIGGGIAGIVTVLVWARRRMQSDGTAGTR